jgi:hypothetical protein
MKWVDGSMYIGEWSRGIQHGKGKMVLQDRTVKEGNFENNVFKGFDGNLQKDFRLQIKM